MDQTQQVRGWTRRFAAFIGRVVRHVWTLLLAVIGSAVLTVPAWIKPWLSATDQRAFDRYTVLSPAVYEWLSITVLVVGFLLACFFVSEEDRLEIDKERIEKQEAESKLADPLFEGDILTGTHWTVGPASVAVEFKIGVRNTGVVPSIAKDWQIHVVPQDETESHSFIGPVPISLSPNVPQQVDRQSHFHDDTAIQPGSAREFTVSFNIPYHVQYLRSRKIEITFREIRNRNHAIIWYGL